jgi:hypothetical protein
LELEAMARASGVSLDAGRVRRLYESPETYAIEERRETAESYLQLARRAHGRGKPREAMKQYALAEAFAEAGDGIAREASGYLRRMRSAARRRLALAAAAAALALLAGGRFLLPPPRSPRPGPGNAAVTSGGGSGRVPEAAGRDAAEPSAAPAPAASPAPSSPASAPSAAEPADRGAAPEVTSTLPGGGPGDRPGREPAVPGRPGPGPGRRESAKIGPERREIAKAFAPRADRPVRGSPSPRRSAVSALPRIAAPEAPAGIPRAAAWAYLWVRTNPPFVRIVVDGQSRGATPLAAPLALTPGRHLLELEREGCLPARDSFTAAPAETVSLRRTLDRKPEAP